MFKYSRHEMPEYYSDLGYRALKCRRWRWLDGMFDGGYSSERFDKYRDGFLHINDDDNAYWTRWGHERPDFSDPATLGCLLALVREAYNDQTIYARLKVVENRWCVCSGASGGRMVLVDGAYLWGDTEAESLVVALEAANAF